MLTMTSSKIINIVLCFNKAYAVCSTVAIYSLLKNSKSKIKLYLILSNDIEDELESIRSIADSFGTHLEVIILDKDSPFNHVNWTKAKYWNEANYLRLMIPSLINEGRVLYLDSDLIVTGDLSELFFMPFDGAVVICALELAHLRPNYKIPVAYGEPFVNTGVMVMDLDTLRKDDFLSKCLSIHDQYKDLICSMDQCIFNKYAEGKKKIVDSKWNTIIHAHLFGKSRFNQLVDAGVIIHFAGPIKPWMEYANAYIIDFWMAYANQIPSLNVIFEKIQTYQQAIYKIVKLEEEGNFFESNLIKNRIINSIQKEARIDFSYISDETTLIKNTLFDKSSNDPRNSLSDIVESILNRPPQTISNVSIHET